MFVLRGRSWVFGSVVVKGKPELADVIGRLLVLAALSEAGVLGTSVGG